MKQFNAELFTSLVRGLGAVDQFISDSPGGADAQVTGDGVQLIRALAGTTESECKGLGLHVSAETARQLCAQVKEGVRAGNLSGGLGSLTRSIQIEMKTRLFLYVEPPKADYYSKPELFGPSVAEKLPSAAFDIEEAGKCLALDRGTACVDHLMRVLEIGLYALALDLKVQNPQLNWQNAIDQVQKATRALPKSDPRKQPYSEAAAHLYNAKYAWRNAVAHSGQAYPVDKAEQVFGSVKGFMQSLADSGLSE